MAKSIYLSESLEREIRKTFHDQPQVLIHLSGKEINEPLSLLEELKRVSKVLILPGEIMESIDKGQEKLLYLKAKAINDKYLTTGRYMSLLRYKELIPSKPKAS